MNFEFRDLSALQRRLNLRRIQNSHLKIVVEFAYLRQEDLLKLRDIIKHDNCVFELRLEGIKDIEYYGYNNDYTYRYEPYKAIQFSSDQFQICLPKNLEGVYYTEQKLYFNIIPKAALYFNSLIFIPERNLCCKSDFFML